LTNICDNNREIKRIFLFSWKWLKIGGIGVIGVVCILCFYFFIENGLCKYNTGLKVQNFQLRMEPIRLINISNFLSNYQRRIGGVATNNCG